MYHPSRGGVRGGRDQFNWDDVKGDKHRENYLGHSIKAPVGRWQKGKDLHWYTRDKNADEEAAAKDEVRRLKEEEEEAMQEMLGLAPKKARRQVGQLDARELSEVLKKVKNQDGEESAPSYAAGERVQGLGFALVPGQTTLQQPGRGQIGPEQSVGVAYEKIPAVTTGQRNQEFSGNDGKRDARKDGPALVEAQVATRPESEDKTSSTGSEEEGVSSRKIKPEKRREEKRTHQKTRKKSKAREGEQDVILHCQNGARSEGKWKVRQISEELGSSKGYTRGRGSRHIKDQSKRDYLSKERRHDDMDNARHDSDSSEGSLQGKARKTSAHPNSAVRRDSRSHHTRNGKTRYDSDSDKETEGSRGFRYIKDSFRRDYLSKERHDDIVNARHDNEGSEGSLQETTRRTSAHPNSQLRRNFRSHYSRNVKVRHDSDSEKEIQRRRGDARRRLDSDSEKEIQRRRGDARRRLDSDSEKEIQRRRGDARRRLDSDSDHGREGRRGDTRWRRHDSDSDDGREGRRGVERQRRHNSDNDNEGEGRRSDTQRTSTSYKDHGKRRSRHDGD